MVEFWYALAFAILCLLVNWARALLRRHWKNFLDEG